MNGLLADVTVVELAGNPGVGYFGKVFADLGATVTRVEGLSGGPGEELAAQIFLHGGKRRETLGGEAGIARVVELIRGADVVVGDVVPKELARLVGGGSSAEDGRLVVALVTEFGLTGPYAGYKGGSMLVHAASGYLQINGDPDREPLRGLEFQPYFQAGVAAFVAAMAALLERERSGLGQVVTTSVMQTLATMHEWTTLRYANAGLIMGRYGNRYPIAHPMAIYRARDGYFSIGVHDAKRSDLLLALAGHADAVGDEPYGSMVERDLNQREYDGLLRPWFESTPRAELLEAFEGIRLPTAPVLSIADVLADEHLVARGFWNHIEVDGRRVSLPGRPVRQWESPLPGAPGGDPEGQFPHRGGDGPTKGPLAGLRVVDVTTGWAGPHGTRLLADLGADVIHVEPPWDRGTVPPDEAFVRHTGFYMENDATEKFWMTNTVYNTVLYNKRSLALRANTPEGKEVLGKLLATADVLVDNLSTQAYESLGLSYTWASSINPSLVVMTLPGYGRWGPAKYRVSFGPQIEAYAGAVSLMGYDGGPPHMFPFAWPDTCASTHSAGYALAGLWARRRTGLGQCFEMSQGEAATSFIAPAIVRYRLTGVEPRRIGNRHQRLAPHGVYPGDGEDRWIAIGVTTDGEWRALCGVIGRDDLGGDAGVNSAAGRKAREDEIDAAIAEWTRSRDVQEAMRTLQSAGVPAFFCLNAKDLIEDPFLATTGAYPKVGREVLMGAPFQMSRTPPRVYRGVPELGDANRELLEEFGYSAPEIERLHESGVLATEPAV